MPTILKINVNRKLTHDFQSKGYGLEIQAELPASAVNNPNEMASASDELFRLAEDLLEEQINKSQGVQPGNVSPQQPKEPVQAQRASTPPKGRMNGNSTGNGNVHHGNGNGTGAYRSTGTTPRGGRGGERQITDAQVNAIQRMAQKLDTNAEAVVQEDFGKNLRELTLKEASRCIENLKEAIERLPAGGGTR